MPINKNHEFEELAGLKCGIVEKNVSAERAGFLRQLLEFNQFEVVIVPSPPPKAAPLTPGNENPDIVDPIEGVTETFTVGVTDYTFNPVNAIFGRLLKTPAGKVVTLAYWKQEKLTSEDDIPYLGTGSG